jgi:CysZ protein
MLPSLAKAIRQIPDPPLMRVIKWGILGALLIYVILIGGFFYLISSSSVFESSWAEWGLDVLGTVALVVLLIFLFPAVLTVIIGFLLEDVAKAVEQRHYPTLPPPRAQSVSEAVLTTLAFIGFALVINIVTLIVVFVIPGLNLLLIPFSPFIFLAVNGYLLGREYFELVAFRRLDPQTARSLRKAQVGRVWLAGAVIAFFLTIPIVNWVVPVIGTAFMLHEFEALRRRHGLV